MRRELLTITVIALAGVVMRRGGRSGVKLDKTFFDFFVTTS